MYNIAVALLECVPRSAIVLCVYSNRASVFRGVVSVRAYKNKYSTIGDEAAWPRRDGKTWLAGRT